MRPCTDRAAGTFLISYVKDRHVEAVKKGGLRLDRDETPGAARRPGLPGVIVSPGNRGTVRHSDRAHGKGASATGSARTARFASGYPWRVTTGADSVAEFGCRRHSNDRWTRDRRALFVRGRAFRTGR